MPRFITVQQWNKYENRRSRGWSMVAAAKDAGISTASARRHEGDRSAFNRQQRSFMDGAILAEAPKHTWALCSEAERALEDFSYFQRRYMGRIATPWQAEAAVAVQRLLETRDKEFVVVNAPPGSGKSTTFTLDIPAWLTVRNRKIRGLIGSKTSQAATRYVQRLKRHLETPHPVKGEGEEVAMGLALDADATLSDDFGAFKPPNKDQWSGDAFVVAQLDGNITSEKEPTWSAYGMDSGFLGMRYDFIVWDDLVDLRVLRTIESRTNQQEWWDDVAEKRLEPGGLLVLQGQRMGADDLYRYALDKRIVIDDSWDDVEMDEPEEGVDWRPAKYQHIVFQAHYDDRCTQQHQLDAPYYPEGCLLDPKRLPWRELRSEMSNPRNNFAVLYQQQDMDPQNTLVDPMWITGGTDPRTGEQFMGCQDNDRGIAELPKGLTGDLLSIATVDPSPAKWWSIQWWVVRCVQGVAYERYLMDHVRQKMDAPTFLDWSEPMHSFLGLGQEWQERSQKLNLPITTWIVEANAAQRFMLQFDHVRRWLAYHRISLIPHQTAANKSDQAYGVQTMGPIYKHGLVRLPYQPRGPAYLASAKLVEEVTHWPGWRFEDCVMAQWFLEWHLPNLVPTGQPLPRSPRPSWMRQSNTWGWRREQKKLSASA